MNYFPESVCNMSHEEEHLMPKEAVLFRNGLTMDLVTPICQYL